MRAGAMRARVTLQQPVEAQNSLGEPVATWTDVDTVWAKVMPVDGREFAQLQSTQAEVTTRVYIRFREDVRPKWRLTYNAHVYDVQAAIDVKDRRRELELVCREVL
jgi:SPP1 family predicted phage head-tail adaptor